MAARLHALPWVEWHEVLHAREVLELLCRSHVCVLPTLDETFGWSVVEAMSVGVPAITTNVCAMPEIVEHGVNGFQISLPLRADRRWAGLDAPRNSVERRSHLEEAHLHIAAGLEEALRCLLEKPELCRSLGYGGLERVKRRHDPSLIAQNLRRLYAVALGD